MNFNDKSKILKDIELRPTVEIEIGCGQNKKYSSAIGIDLLDYPGVDIVGNIYDVLAAFPGKSVDKVYAYHFIEHISNVKSLLSELSRVLKDNGVVEFIAPHFSNPYFYSDPTHQNFFGLYTFSYFASSSPFSRLVPTYDHKPEFSIVKIDLIFKSPRQFIFRYAFKRIIGLVFNSCTYMQELYEENFCYLFPCYEVRYILKK